MFGEPSASGLEVLQSADDEVSVSEDGEIRFSVRVYNPGVMKVPFRAGFICGVGFSLVSLETKETKKSLPKAAFSSEHPVVPSRLSDERMFYLVDKEFMLWWRQSERFYLVFRRDAPFKAGDAVVFTVRLLLENGSVIRDERLDFTLG